MPTALLLPVITCAAVLLLSGIAKLREPATVDTAFTSLGVPRALDTPLVRRLFPWVEIALGAWLLLATGPALVVVALVTLALFVAYLVLVVRAVRRPEPVDCGCFGALGDSEVTSVTVWRNAALVLSAALAVLAGVWGSGVVPALVNDSGAWAWVAATALSAAVVGLVVYRAPAGSRAADHGGSALAAPKIGPDGEYVRDAIPDAQVLTEDGKLVFVAHQARRAAHLLVFLSPGCGPCGRLGPLVAGWSEELAPVVVKAVVAGQPVMVESWLTYLQGHAWFDPYGITRKAFTGGNPSAVLLGADGLVAGGPVHGEEDVLSFIAQVRDQLREAREAGEMLPVEPDATPEDEAVVTDAR
jgi:hypothetical protein